MNSPDAGLSNPLSIHVLVNLYLAGVITGFDNYFLFYGLVRKQFLTTGHHSTEFVSSDENLTMHHLWEAKKGSRPGPLNQIDLLQWKNGDGNLLNIQLNEEPLYTDLYYQLLSMEDYHLYYPTVSNRRTDGLALFFDAKKSVNIKFVNKWPRGFLPTNPIYSICISSQRVDGFY